MVHEASRRTFVGSLLAGVPTLGVTVVAQQPPFPSPDVSPADSLVVYMDMLRGVLSELVDRIVAPWTTAQNDLSRRVKELSATVEQLANELGRRAQDASARLLALAAMGRGIATALADGGIVEGGADRLMLTRFTEACRTCTDLMPVQDVTVSARVRQLIDDVIRMVRGIDSQNTVTDAANRTFNDAFRRIQQDLDSVRDLLFKSAAAVTAESDPRTRAVARQRHQQLLDDLEAAATKLADIEKTHRLEPGRLPRRDALVAVIRGTREWLASPGPRAVASLEPIAFEDPQETTWTADRRQKLWDVLNQYSPAATLLREIYLRALVTPIWVGYKDRATRERLIREVLRVFPSNPPAEQSAGFVSTLATFV